MPTRRVQLPPVAASAAQARRVVRDVLAQAGREAWLDAAELAVSEIVTNGVLHARTPLALSVTVSDTELLVEVADGVGALPEQRHYGQQATTGRGMTLVATISSEHGVRQLADGKVVWFCIREGAAGDLTGSGFDALTAAWEEPATSPVDERGLEVRLLGLSPTLWRAARVHHEALLRELTLVRGTNDLDLHVDAARNAVWSALERSVSTTGGEDRVPWSPAAALEAPAAVDLLLQLPREASQEFAALQDALDEGEALARQGRLLARPALPEVVAVRDWLCEQVIAQLAGAPASPWVGADAEVFARDVRTDLEDLGWDASVVRDTHRGAVAADESNRIIAVSRRLSDVLGWAPEELVGRRVVALVPPRLRAAHVAGFTRHLATGQTSTAGAERSIPVLRADGTEITCRFALEVHASGGGHAVYVAWIEPLPT
ncbi:MAG: PAS domain S-box protein [Mycobacteriales bacterium]